MDEFSVLWSCCKAERRPLFPLHEPLWDLLVTQTCSCTPTLFRRKQWGKQTNKLVIDYPSLVCGSDRQSDPTKLGDKRRTIKVEHNSSSLPTLHPFSQNLLPVPSFAFPPSSVLCLCIPLAWHSSRWRSFQYAASLKDRALLESLLSCGAIACYSLAVDSVFLCIPPFLSLMMYQFIRHWILGRGPCDGLHHSRAVQRGDGGGGRGREWQGRIQMFKDPCNTHEINKLRHSNTCTLRCQ